MTGFYIQCFFYIHNKFSESGGEEGQGMKKIRIMIVEKTVMTLNMKMITENVLVHTPEEFYQNVWMTLFMEESIEFCQTLWNSCIFLRTEYRVRRSPPDSAGLQWNPAELSRTLVDSAGFRRNMWGMVKYW